MSRAKLLLNKVDRQSLLNAKVISYYCILRSISQAEFYDMVSENPSIVSDVDRLARGIAYTKPSMMQATA